MIDGIKGCVYIIQQSVDAGSFRRRPAALPALPSQVWLNVQFGIKTTCHTINRDTDENRVTAIDFLLVLFHKEKNVECTLHKLTFLGYKLR